MNNETFVDRIGGIFSKGIEDHNNEYNYAYKLVKLREEVFQELTQEQLESIDALTFVTDHRFEGDEMKLRNAACWQNASFNVDRFKAIESLVNKVNSPWLKAKFYDVVWSTLKQRKPEYVKNAVLAYMQFPLKAVLHTSSYWKRGLYLSSWAKLDVEKDEMISLLVKSALSGNEVFVITRLLNKLKLVKPYVKELTDVLATKIDTVTEDESHWLAAEYWKLILDISGKHGPLTQSHEEYQHGLTRTLCLWARQNETDGNIHAAADHFRQAINLLKGLSNKFKVNKNINAEIEQIEVSLVGLRKKVYEQLEANAECKTVDLSEHTKLTKQIIKGNDIEELIYIPDMDYRYILRAQRKFDKDDQNNFFRNFFGGVSFADDDGRRLGSFNRDSKEAKRIEAYRMFIRFCDMQAAGYVLPALEILKNNLHLQESDFYDLSVNCPLIPDSQKALIAKALWHGYNKDFVSAIMVLSPLSESILRHVLKESGIPTVTIEQASESEKSMNMLLDIASKKAILNREVVFKVEAIFTSPFGLNFRNKVAHGMVTDNSANSLSAVYVWWLCLKWIIIYSPHKQ